MSARCRSPGGAGAGSSRSLPSSPVSDPGLVFSVPGSSLLTRRLLRLRSCGGPVSPVRRRQREMTPADKKDSTYWEKRRKNNDAAKRSRERRRLTDLMLEDHLLALSEENARLRTSLRAGGEGRVAFPGARFTPPVVASAVSSSPRPAHGWGNDVSAPASILDVRHQGAACHSASWVRSAEAEVSSSVDIPSSSIQACLPMCDAPCTLAYTQKNWLLPHLSASVMCSSRLLPWRSYYVPPPAVYPGPPLYIQGQGVSSAPAVLSQFGVHLSPDGRYRTV